MNIYHRYKENLLYISSDAIARTIAAVKESQNNECFLVRLTDLGIFDSYAGNYKYIVCIDKVMRQTVYLKIYALYSDSDLVAWFASENHEEDRISDLLNIKRSRIFRCIVYCPDLKINSNEGFF